MKVVTLSRRMVKLKKKKRKEKERKENRREDKRRKVKSETIHNTANLSYYIYI